jgi:hypothetical protein
MRITARVAFRHIAEVSEQEREAVLVTCVEVLEEPEAKLASEALFHLREAHKKQMELKGIIGGADPRSN